MLDVKKTLAKLLDAVNTVDYIVERKTISFSFSNQRYKSVTASVAKTGYQPIGIVGWQFSTVDWMLSWNYINDTTATLYIFRTASATASATITLNVLYRKV